MDRRNFIQGAGVAVAAAALPSERKRRLRASLQIKEQAWTDTWAEQIRRGDVTPWRRWMPPLRVSRPCPSSMPWSSGL